MHGVEFARAAQTTKIFAHANSVDDSNIDQTYLTAVIEKATDIFEFISKNNIFVKHFDVGWQEKDILSSLFVIEEIIRGQSVAE